MVTMVVFTTNQETNIVNKNTEFKQLIKGNILGSYASTLSADLRARGRLDDILEVARQSVRRDLGFTV